MYIYAHIIKKAKHTDDIRDTLATAEIIININETRILKNIIPLK